MGTRTGIETGMGTGMGTRTVTGMGTGMGTRTGTGMGTGTGTGMGTGKGMGQGQGGDRDGDRERDGTGMCVNARDILENKKKVFFFPRTTSLVVIFPYVGRLLQRRMTFPHMGKNRLGKLSETPTPQKIHKESIQAENTRIVDRVSRQGQ